MKSEKRERKLLALSMIQTCTVKKVLGEAGGQVLVKHRICCFGDVG